MKRSIVIAGAPVFVSALLIAAVLKVDSIALGLAEAYYAKQDVQLTSTGESVLGKLSGLANLLFGVLSVVLSYLLKGLHSITQWVESMTGAGEQEVEADE